MSSNKRIRAKIERKAPTYPQGGNIISPQQMQVYMAQLAALQAAAAKGNKVSKNDAMFSPGVPLESQPGMNPKGLPQRWQFPIAYNTFQPDRTLGNSDIPTFGQLRALARCYSGITLCERVWGDMVPKLELNIGLTKAMQAQGVDEKKYQKQIAFFTNFFAKPDGVTDIHSWLRKALKEQTQIDELYLYKQRDRAGRLLGLQIIAGDQMKPLLDDWGAIQGYQQFPRGVPGQQWNLQQMIRYNESPSADTPFGFSRVERIILEVNQALRKKKKDLARFTEGNIPAGIMEVPEASNWTPDQIEAYEVMWNAMIAGSEQQQVRVRFTQPGMKYTALEEYQLITEFDQFLLNIATAAYGVSMADISFTGDIHKSSDDGQQNMLFRRTLYPVTSMYAHIFTTIMREDFPPELSGDMLEVSFGGFEEAEDIETLATAYAAFLDHGVIAPSDVAAIMKFPDVPKTGPYIMDPKNGPLFIDDLADPAYRAAKKQAAMAGFKQATQPPPVSAQEDGTGEASDEADQSLNDLGRYNMVHDNTGEFGFSSTGKPPLKGHHKGSHKSAHHKGHHKGHVSAFAHMQHLAARFAKLEARKLGRRWSASQRAAAGRMEDIFQRIANGVHSGGQQHGIDALLDQAWAQAKILFSGNQKGLDAMARSLTSIDKINDKGKLRAVDAEETEAYDSSWSDDLEDELDALELEEIEHDDSTPTQPQGAQQIPHKLSRADAPDGPDEVRPSHGIHHADASGDYKRWRQRAIDDVKAGRAFRGFTTSLIPEHIHEYISDELQKCTSVVEVKDVFERVKEGDTPVTDMPPGFTGGPQIWQPEDLAQRLATLKEQGVEYLTWESTSPTGGCKAICDQNDGVTRKLGEPFPSGHILPQAHPNCACEVVALQRILQGAA